MRRRQGRRGRGSSNSPRGANVACCRERSCVAEGAPARIAIAVGDRQWPRRGVAARSRRRRRDSRTCRSSSTICPAIRSSRPMAEAYSGASFVAATRCPRVATASPSRTGPSRRAGSSSRRAPAYLPAVLRDGGRRFGLAAHLYALRRQGDQGIGDFTTLRETGAATARAGGAVVALNPLHALFAADRERASPYQPSDRRFLDPIYIDVERVPDLAASPQARRMLDQHSAAHRASVGTTKRRLCRRVACEAAWCWPNASGPSKRGHATTRWSRRSTVSCARAARR